MDAAVAVAAAAPAGVAANPIDFNLTNLAGGFETAYEDFTCGTNSALSAAATTQSSTCRVRGIGAFTSHRRQRRASLSGAFARNPNLRLFVGVNYSDLDFAVSTPPGLPSPT